MSNEHLWAVIMAGGSGTRFWPQSRAESPKQLTRIVGDDTMIQATVARLQPLIPAERVLVVTTKALAEATRRQLPMLPPEQIIAEPVGCDTAPCVALAAEVVKRLDPEATMILLPADQVISPVDRFQETLAAGAVAAADGALVTYGLQPRFAATGYGYIHVGEARGDELGCPVNAVSSFVEKPDQATADQYLASGEYRWNSGIFTWRVDAVLRELGTHCPWLTDALAPVGEAYGSDAFDSTLEAAYLPLKKISIDYALMENAKDILVVTCDFTWDDVGSWDALYDHVDADDAGLRTRGEVITIDCANSLVVNQGGPLVAAAGLDGITVVSTEGAVLVVPRGQGQLVKQVHAAIQADHPDLA